MVLKYINSNRVSVIVLFSLLPVLYWMPSLVTISGQHESEVATIFMGRWIASFNDSFRVLSSLIALLLLMLNGYLLIQLNTVHFFIPVRTQLPFLFYVMLTACFTQHHHLTPELVSSTLLVVVFFRLLSTYKIEGISMRFLDCGLLIATASLFYFPVIFLFPFLLVALGLLRPLAWREWAFSILGLVLPYIFVISGYYLADIPVNNLVSDISGEFERVQKALRLSQQIYWIFILAFMFYASYFLAGALDSMKIHARKSFLVFLAFFLNSMLVFLVIGGADTGMVYIVAIPLAYLFTFYFVKHKTGWLNVALLAIFLLLFIGQRIM